MKPEQKNMTLTMRLILGFASVCFILVAVIVLSLYQVRLLDKSINSFIDVRVPTISASTNLLLNINQAGVALRNWVITHQEEYKNERNAVWNNKIIPTLAVLNTLSQRWRSVENKVNLKNLEAGILALKDMQNKVEALAVTNPKLAAQLMIKEGNNSLFVVNDLGQKLLNSQDKLLSSDSNETQEDIYFLIVTQWLALLAAILISTVLALRISKSISDPVKNITETMIALAKGEQREKVNITGPREIQSLSASINQMVQTIQDITNFATAISQGQYSITIKKRSNSDKLIIALQEMLKILRANKNFYDDKTWLQNGTNALLSKITDNTDLKLLASQTLNEICHYLNAGVGALYLREHNKNGLSLFTSFAFVEREALANYYEFGQGIVGQVAQEQKPILLKNIRRNNMVISTALTEEAPLNVYTFPLLDKRDLIGVITLGFHEEIDNKKFDYINQISSVLSSSISVSEQKEITEKLLDEQKQLTEKLQIQQEELKSANEELESQTEELKASDEELRLRDEEQRTLNFELEERNKALESQKNEVELARKGLFKKAGELQQANKYKSEFLSNMSHELRTPLNSLLLLAKLLAENKEDNLTDEQIESLQIVYSSGQDLLHLINDILDLSKVEAGKISIELEEADIVTLVKSIAKDFSHVASAKNIELSTLIDPDLITKKIVTDSNRVRQILKNLIANAIKFTEKGGVKIILKNPPDGQKDYAVAISVADSGIGIPADQHQFIFQSFYQCDGSSKRKFGGTGLGLSISMQLAKLLNGDIHFNSEPNHGSTFTLFLPAVLSLATAADNNRSALKPDIFEKAKEQISVKNLLVVENDKQFSNILVDVCKKRGFNCLQANTGEKALQLAVTHKPIGILLDVDLPDISGKIVADRLKGSPETSKIPIHFVSGNYKHDKTKNLDAISLLTKPITAEQLDDVMNNIARANNEKVSKVLVVEDDINLQKNICELLSKKADHVVGVSTGKEALNLLKSKRFDCMVLDLGLPDMTGFKFLQLLGDSSSEPYPPIIIYTGRELSEEENALLQRYSNNIILKNTNSLPRLLDETSLFLHSIESMTVQTVEPKLKLSFDPKKQLKDKKILLVDDDMRNTFTLAKILKSYDVEVLVAPNGKVALEILNKETDVSAVLMDVMMPIMDGFETIEKIRKQERFKHLPIIALTAKTMPSDKDKCLSCGATDYLTKPLDMDKLLISLRAWV